MTKVGHFPDDVVGSADVTLVIHWPGGWVTQRRSATWSDCPPWHASVGDDGIITVDVEGKPECRFRRVDVGIGRRFPDIRHYWLSEEVT